MWSDTHGRSCAAPWLSAVGVCLRVRVPAQVERVVQSPGRRRVARALQGRWAAAAPGSQSVAVCPRFTRGAAGSSENNRGARVRGQAAAGHLCRVQQRALRWRPFQDQAERMGSVHLLCVQLLRLRTRLWVWRALLVAILTVVFLPSCACRSVLLAGRGEIRGRVARRCAKWPGQLCVVSG